MSLQIDTATNDVATSVLDLRELPCARADRVAIPARVNARSPVAI
jgi:hypothetical protein